MALVVETYVVEIGTIGAPTTLVNRSAQFTSVKVNCKREQLKYRPLSVRADASESGAFENSIELKANFSTHAIKRLFRDMLRTGTPVLLAISPNGGTPAAENPQFRMPSAKLFSLDDGGESMKLEDVSLVFHPGDGQLTVWYAEAGADKDDLF